MPALPPSYQNVRLFCLIKAILGRRSRRSFMPEELPVSAGAYTFDEGVYFFDARDAPVFTERNKEGVPSVDAFLKVFQDRVREDGRWSIAIVGSAHDSRSFPVGWPCTGMLNHFFERSE